jgi:hypothetical protein
MAFLAVIVIWFIVGAMAALCFGRLMSIVSPPASIPKRQASVYRPALAEKRRRVG